MAAPTYISSGSQFKSGSGDNVITATGAAGDLVIVTVKTSVNNPSSSTGSGATNLTKLSATQKLDGLNVYHSTYSFELTASSGTVTFTSSASHSARWAVYRDANAIIYAESSGASGLIDPPSNATGTSRDYRWVATGQGASTNPTAPTNYTLRQAFDGSGIADRALTAATEDPGTFGGPSGAWVANTLALYFDPPFATTVANTSTVAGVMDLAKSIISTTAATSTVTASMAVTKSLVSTTTATSTTAAVRINTGRPYIRATANTAEQVLGSSYTVDLPTHIAGDLLLCFIGTGDNYSFYTSAATAAAGWRLNRVITLSQTDAAAVILWKIAESASETSPVIHSGGNVDSWKGRSYAIDEAQDVHITSRDSINNVNEFAAINFDRARSGKVFLFGAGVIEHQITALSGYTIDYTDVGTPIEAGRVTMNVLTKDIVTPATSETPGTPTIVNSRGMAAITVFVTPTAHQPSGGIQVQKRWNMSDPSRFNTLGGGGTGEGIVDLDWTPSAVIPAQASGFIFGQAGVSEFGTTSPPTPSGEDGFFYSMQLRVDLADPNIGAGTIAPATWEYSGITWEDLGVPAGYTVFGVRGSLYWARGGTAFSTADWYLGDGVSSNAFELTHPGGTENLVGAEAVLNSNVMDTAWRFADGNNVQLSRPSNESIALNLNAALTDVGTSGSLYIDNVTLTIDAAPNPVLFAATVSAAAIVTPNAVKGIAYNSTTNATFTVTRAQMPGPARMATAIAVTSALTTLLDGGRDFVAAPAATSTVTPAFQAGNFPFVVASSSGSTTPTPTAVPATIPLPTHAVGDRIAVIALSQYTAGGPVQSVAYIDRTGSVGYWDAHRYNEDYVVFTKIATTTSETLSVQPDFTTGSTDHIIIYNAIVVRNADYWDATSKAYYASGPGTLPTYFTDGYQFAPAVTSGEGGRYSTLGALKESVQQDALIISSFGGFTNNLGINGDADEAIPPVGYTSLEIVTGSNSDPYLPYLQTAQKLETTASANDQWTPGPAHESAAAYIENILVFWNSPKVTNLGDTAVTTKRFIWSDNSISTTVPVEALQGWTGSCPQGVVADGVAVGLGITNRKAINGLTIQGNGAPIHETWQVGITPPYNQGDELWESTYNSNSLLHATDVVDNGLYQLGWHWQGTAEQLGVPSGAAIRGIRHVNVDFYQGGDFKFNSCTIAADGVLYTVLPGWTTNDFEDAAPTSRYYSHANAQDNVFGSGGYAQDISNMAVFADETIFIDIWADVHELVTGTSNVPPRLQNFELVIEYENVGSALVDTVNVAVESDNITIGLESLVDTTEVAVESGDITPGVGKTIDTLEVAVESDDITVVKEKSMATAISATSTVTTALDGGRNFVAAISITSDVGGNIVEGLRFVSATAATTVLGPTPQLDVARPFIATTNVVSAVTTLLATVRDLASTTTAVSASTVSTNKEVRFAANVAVTSTVTAQEWRDASPEFSTSISASSAVTNPILKRAVPFAAENINAAAALTVGTIQISYEFATVVSATSTVAANLFRGFESTLAFTSTVTPTLQVERTFGGTTVSASTVVNGNIVEGLRFVSATVAQSAVIEPTNLERNRGFATTVPATSVVSLTTFDRNIKYASLIAATSFVDDTILAIITNTLLLELTTGLYLTETVPYELQFTSDTQNDTAIITDILSDVILDSQDEGP